MGRGLRIAPFNVESLDDRSRSIDFDDRIAVLRPQLNRLRADVLCLQEVNAHAERGSRQRSLTALERLIADTEYADFHRAVSFSRGGERPADRHNLVILSRPEIVTHRQVWHHLVQPPLYAPVTQNPPAEQPVAVEWDRPFLHAELSLDGGRRLHLFNIHLRAPRAAYLKGQKIAQGVWASVGGWAEGFYLAEMKRAGQALEVRLAVEAVFDADPEALVAVCGDYNADDSESPVRSIRGDEEDTGNGHLAARMLVPLDRGLSESQRYSVVHRGRRIMLDHILVSRQLLGWYLRSEVHNETLGDELVSPLMVRGSPETYHAPVVAEFLLPDPPAERRSP